MTGTHHLEYFVIGDSEDCEAEYGERAELPVTLLSLYNDEIYSTEGFASIDAAKRAVTQDEIEKSQIIYL